MPHRVDQHVGMKIRQRRWLVGMTQQELGESVGIKFQQIQKYESGANRVSASRLWQIANTLDVPISFFFEGIVLDNEPVNGAAHEGGLNGSANGHAPDIMNSKETAELIKAYYDITESQRRRLLELAKAMGNAG